MFWWYFIIGCDGEICPPCRKWYTNCGGQHQVGKNLTNPSNKKMKTGHSPVLHPFEKLVDTGAPWLCMITATFKCRIVAKWVLWWFLMCFQFWRLLDRALCFDDISSLGVMVRSALPLGSGSTTGVWQSEYFDVFSCVSSFEDCWLGPYVLMIFHHWMWW